jgi:hypothetical protein
MKHPIRLALLLLLTVATVASAQLYPLFGPATGILKGTTSSPQTSAAASSDVAALWSGTCNSSSFLRGDGVCATPSGGSGTVTSITAGTGLTGGTITTSGTIALSSPVSATNGGTGEAGTVSGVMKGNATSAVSAAASSDVIALWSGTCNSTTFLRADGSCQPASGGGSGTVTSVALTMPSGFSVSGSPITNSGTLAVSTSLSGLLKGTGSAFTTAAASDVSALWSGTCNSTTFLRGDGTCAAAGGGSTPVPGTIPDLVFWMRSDLVLGGTGGYGLPLLQNSTPWLTGLSAVGATTATTGVLVSGTQLNSLNVLAWPGSSAGRYQFPDNANSTCCMGVLFHKFTIFIVANASSFSGSPTFFSGPSSSLAFRLETSGKMGLVKDFVALIGTSTTAQTVSTWFQGNATYDDSSGAFAFRSSQAANGSGTNVVGITVISNSIGWDNGGGAGDFAGSIAEIIIYNRVLSGGEITSVESYLNTKWGV